MSNEGERSISSKKVSVIIPTFNRLKFLLEAIESVKRQTHQNIEIVISNDCSTEKEYYTYDFSAIGCKIIHLPENSKEIFGQTCTNYVRNMGIWKSTGDYIAFLDDDDIWFPQKLELQLAAMEETGCEMSCTDGYSGKGRYDPNKIYPLYNKEDFYDRIVEIYKSRGAGHLVQNGFPRIWDYNFLNIHNCVINSSAILSRKVLYKTSDLQHVFTPGEDHNSWLNALKFTKCVYIDRPLMYYDHAHGNGQLHYKGY